VRTESRKTSPLGSSGKQNILRYPKAAWPRWRKGDLAQSYACRQFPEMMRRASLVSTFMSSRMSIVIDDPSRMHDGSIPRLEKRPNYSDRAARLVSRKCPGWTCLIGMLATRVAAMSSNLALARSRIYWIRSSLVQVGPRERKGGWAT
jgi:hypothetical protein